LFQHPYQGIDPWDIVVGKNLDGDLTLDYGNGDQVLNDDWANGSQHHVEEITSGDGSTLLSSQVDLLIQDMATFGADHGGISWQDAVNQYEEETRAVLTSHWQVA
jgi:hypothetical protein